jgi:hypothetical protein
MSRERDEQGAMDPYRFLSVFAPLREYLVLLSHQTPIACIRALFPPWLKMAY